MDESDLTERERKVAKLAADMAVKKVMDDFYAGVGRTVVQRAFITIGAIVVGFALGKGWVSSDILK